MGNSVQGEMAALPMFIAACGGVKEGVLTNARESAGFLISTCVNAVPTTEWSYSWGGGGEGVHVGQCPANHQRAGLLLVAVRLPSLYRMWSE